MSIEHKAFLFDHRCFVSELAPILFDALTSGSSEGLRAFVESDRANLKDPYEGEPLPENWEDLMEIRDPHQYGDFALTKYYNPAEDLGLGYKWSEYDEALNSYKDGLEKAILGVPFGPAANRFDPGKLGSYFQDPSSVLRNLGILDELRPASGMEGTIEASRSLLAIAAEKGLGLYVTF